MKGDSRRAPIRHGILRTAIQRKTAYEVAHDSLRHAILNGELPPGTRLVQADIAHQLGISTTPVREALRDLAGEGLIHFDTYRGAIVHTPTLDEVKEVYELRLALAPIAVTKAIPHITGRELDDAMKLANEMDHEADPGSWVELNRQFHAILDGAAQSPRLAAILTTLRDLATIYVALSIRLRPRQMADGNKDHKNIVRAFRKNDARLAAALTRQHFESTVQAIEEVWESRS